MNNFLKKMLPAIVIFSISLLIAIKLNNLQNQNACSDGIYNLVFHLTEKYQCRQISAAVIMFLYGLILAAYMFQGRDFVFISAVSYPLAVGLWCIVLCIYCFLGIPCQLIFILPPFAVGMLYLCICKKKELIKILKNDNLWVSVLLASSVAIILSTGLLPGIVTGDSYYFVYLYGEIIAETGKMSFDLTGTYMTWAGVMPALMSSFSALFGYETILVMHYMLVGSMILLMGYEWYISLMNKGVLEKEIIFLIVLSSCLIMFFISPIEMISSYQISNTYTMVYSVMFLILGERYWIRESDYGRCDTIEIIMCIWGIWITMSRPEGFVLFAFFIFMLSYMQANHRKMTFVCIPPIIFEFIYLLKVLIGQKMAYKENLASRFSPMVVVVIITTMIVLLFYSIFHRNTWVVQIKKYLPFIVIMLLPVISISYGLFFCIDIFKVDIDAIFSNFNNELWGYFPHVAILSAFAILRESREINWLRWMLIIGYIFLNLAFNFARNEILIKNFGDSYNRILLSIVPYIIFCLVDWIICEVNARNV